MVTGRRVAVTFVLLTIGILMAVSLSSRSAPSPPAEPGEDGRIGLVYLPLPARSPEEYWAQATQLPPKKEGALLTLAEAQSLVSFHIRTPGYPPDASLVGVHLWQTIYPDGSRDPIQAQLEYRIEQTKVMIYESLLPPGSSPTTEAAISNATPVAIGQGVGAAIAQTPWGPGISLHWADQEIGITMYGELPLDEMIHIAETMQAGN